jgi:uncharacterized protein with von Willebrand factor type A (vWA) domain
MDKEISNVYNQDIREKRQAKNGASHRASRGKISSVRTPLSFMSKQDKKEYTKSISKRYYIMTWEELKKKPKEERVKILNTMLENSTLKEVAEQLGVNPGTLNSMMNYLRRGRKYKPAQKEKSLETKDRTNKCTINFSGNYLGKDIVDKLTAFGLSLSDDEVYEINLVIKF